MFGQAIPVPCRFQHRRVVDGLELSRDAVVDDPDARRIHAGIGTERGERDLRDRDQATGFGQGAVELTPVPEALDGVSHTAGIQQRDHVVDRGYQRHLDRRGGAVAGHVKQVDPRLLDYAGEDRAAGAGMRGDVGRHIGEVRSVRHQIALLILAEDNELLGGARELEQEIAAVRAYAAPVDGTRVEPYPHAAPRRSQCLFLPRRLHFRFYQKLPGVCRSPTESAAAGWASGCSAAGFCRGNLTTWAKGRS